MLTNEEILLDTFEDDRASTVKEIFKLYKSKHKEWLLPQHHMFNLEIAEYENSDSELIEEYLGTVNIKI